jgi:hypothetical protein
MFAAIPRLRSMMSQSADCGVAVQVGYEGIQIVVE